VCKVDNNCSHPDEGDDVCAVLYDTTFECRRNGRTAVTVQLLRKIDVDRAYRPISPTAAIETRSILAIIGNCRTFFTLSTSTINRRNHIDTRRCRHAAVDADEYQFFDEKVKGYRPYVRLRAADAPPPTFSTVPLGCTLVAHCIISYN